MLPSERNDQSPNVSSCNRQLQLQRGVHFFEWVIITTNKIIKFHRQLTIWAMILLGSNTRKVQKRKMEDKTVKTSCTFQETAELESFLTECSLSEFESPLKSLLSSELHDESFRFSVLKIQNQEVQFRKLEEEEDHLQIEIQQSLEILQERANEKCLSAEEESETQKLQSYKEKLGNCFQRILKSVDEINFISDSSEEDSAMSTSEMSECDDVSMNDENEPKERNTTCVASLAAHDKSCIEEEEGYITRSALGRMAKVGDFYDARRDVFLHGNLLTGHPSQCTVVTDDTKVQSIHTNFYPISSIGKIKEQLQIDDNLLTSVRCGFLDLSGAGKLFEDIEDDTPQLLRWILCQTVKTRTETINLDASISLEPKSIFSDCTHVVFGVVYGCNTVVNFRGHRPRQSVYEEDAVKKVFEEKYEKCNTLDSVADMPDTEANEKQRDLFSFRCQEMFSDIGLKNLPRSLDECLRYVKAIPSTMNLPGVPIVYKLLDISSLARKFNLPVLHPKCINLSDSSIRKIEQKFNQASNQLRRVEDLWFSMRRYEEPIWEKLRQLTSTFMQEILAAKSVLRKRMQDIVPRVRENPLHIFELDAVFFDFIYSYSLKKKVDKFFKDNDFNRFIDFDKNLRVDLITVDKYRDVINNQAAICVLFYTTQDMAENGELWKKTRNFFLQYRSKKSRFYFAAVTGRTLEELVISEQIGTGPRIVIGRKNRYITKNLLEDLTTLKTFNFAIPTLTAQPAENDIRSLVQVNIPCPNQECRTSSGEPLEWICSVCFTHLMYNLEAAFHCRCGRRPFEKFSFKCKSEARKSSFVDNKADSISSYLTNLQPNKTVDILLIGETGAGKTCFINALQTYLNHNTFDDALTKPFEFVIPFRFTLDQGNEAAPTIINYGTSTNEVYTSASPSVTQKPRTYQFRAGGTVISIIDTPGVGNIEFLDYTKEVIQGYASKLQSVNLICFVLPAEADKLRERFDFYFNEFMTMLDKSAAGNICFCVTHAAALNFEIDRIIQLLNDRLQKFPKLRNLSIKATLQNVFMVDNLAFRYLSAANAGITFDVDEWVRQCFNVSYVNALRLLDYATSCTPHSTKVLSEILTVTRLKRTLINSNISYSGLMVPDIPVPFLEAAQAFLENNCIMPYDALKGVSRTEEKPSCSTIKSESVRKLKTQKQNITFEDVMKSARSKTESVVPSYPSFVKNEEFIKLQIQPSEKETIIVAGPKEETCMKDLVEAMKTIGYDLQLF